MKKFYITTPIYYPNARPHVGSAYTTIVCDAIARYKRMCGYDVAFLTGTDEHGEKLQRAADEAGIPVERFVAQKRELFKELWRTLGIGEFQSLGDGGAGLSRQDENGGLEPTRPPIKRLFVHTSQNPAHVKSVQWMIRRADKAGYIEKKKYEGRYCVFDERYVSDSPEPVNCDICGRSAELISEENYFFRLSAFRERLLDLYEKQPSFVLPDFRMNEVKSFVKSGLRDISISRRRLKWGIPWPDDPEQVVYVWYDALTSYLTGIGFAGEERSPDFEKYWPADVHMIGKDILRFHAIYWPAFLWAAGLPLPKTIFAHGWIYYEQDKMSKSKGNVVYPEPIIKSFEELGAPGNDALRYYLLRDTPFGQDAHFSYEGLIHRYNSDLANGLGNLASRSLAMVRQFCAGVVPPPVVQTADQASWDASHVVAGYLETFESLDFASALVGLWVHISQADKLIVDRKPWDLAKTGSPADQEAINDTVYRALETLRIVSIFAYPALPASAGRLWKQLGLPGSVAGQAIDDRLHFRQTDPRAKVGKPEPIFPRLDKQKTLARLHELAEEDRLKDETAKETKLEPEQEPAAVVPVIVPASDAEDSAATTPKITIDDFAKVDLRAGTILSAEPIPGATKLLKLQVDIGTEVRQLCAGIAEYYKPEQLIGMKVVIVANLQPRKLRGVESNGMVVAASIGDEGRPVLVTFKEDVPNGAKLK